MASELHAAEQQANDEDARKQDALQAISALCTHAESTFLEAGCARESVIKVLSFVRVHCLGLHCS
jgi:hypothetical protein